MEVIFYKFPLFVWLETCFCRKTEPDLVLTSCSRQTNWFVHN